MPFTGEAQGDARRTDRLGVSVEADGKVDEVEDMSEQQECQCQSAVHGHRPGRDSHIQRGT